MFFFCEFFNVVRFGFANGLLLFVEGRCATDLKLVESL